MIKFFSALIVSTILIVSPALSAEKCVTKDQMFAKLDEAPTRTIGKIEDSEILKKIQVRMNINRANANSSLGLVPELAGIFILKDTNIPTAFIVVLQKDGCVLTSASSSIPMLVIENFFASAGVSLPAFEAYSQYKEI